jgi:hypothetical protein
MDGKAAVLTAAGVFNPRAGAVVDPLFSSSAFFDPRDLVQVKYEMVRRVLVDRVPVTVAAARSASPVPGSIPPLPCWTRRARQGWCRASPAQKGRAS